MTNLTNLKLVISFHSFLEIASINIVHETESSTLPTTDHSASTPSTDEPTTVRTTSTEKTTITSLKNRTSIDPVRPAVTNITALTTSVRTSRMSNRTEAITSNESELDYDQEKYCSQFYNSCTDCLSKTGSCLFYWPNANCYASPKLKNDCKTSLKFLGVGSLYSLLCKLQLPVEDKMNEVNSFKLGDLSTQNCLLSNNATFVFAILFMLLIVFILILLCCQLRSCLSKRRNSSKFRTKKRFDKQFPNGWAYEMQKQSIPSARSNQIMRKHGVNFVGSNVYQNRASGSNVSDYVPTSNRSLARRSDRSIDLVRLPTDKDEREPAKARKERIGGKRRRER